LFCVYCWATLICSFRFHLLLLVVKNSKHYWSSWRSFSSRWCCPLSRSDVPRAVAWCVTRIVTVHKACELCQSPIYNWWDSFEGYVLFIVIIIHLWNICMTYFNNKDDLFTHIYVCYIKIFVFPLKCVAEEKSLITLHLQYEPCTVF
jgi:hypothetical protein